MEVRFLTLIILFFIKVCDIVECSGTKSSLTFVIDNTISMTDDIEEVKIGANAIFDTVIKTNNSQIEDFVLVTFRDPDFRLNTKTKDRDAFKRAFNDDQLIGNWDCPEMSLSGIELALQNSREGSFLYVFTDASAKDYYKYDEVEALAQKKGCQIVFVLTGICSTKSDPDYLVYHKISKATNGAVFHLESKEIGQILKYVENTIESRKNVITSKTFPAGYENTFDVVVDGDMKELVIAVSGESPSVGVTDSGGTKWPTTNITRLSEVAIVKVVGVKPGVYKVQVGSKSDTHVVVSGSTSVHFQHGFSIIMPSAISDTVKRPVPGEKSHISIKLAAEGDVELHSVQLLDMDDNVIVETPLKLVNKIDQFYITTDLVVPPNHIFRVAIKGYDHSRKSHLTRISLTPIKPQEIKIATVKTKVPVVNIDGSPKIDAEYDKPLQLKCKVSGYPKPSVIWESDDKSAVLSHTMSPVELPYDYVSVLEINNVKKNTTFTCVAVNSAGNGDDSIQTKVNTFFKIVALPEDMTIEYQKERKIQCKAEALPPASVTWYKDSRPLRLDGNMDLSADGSVLTIRSMEPYMVGDYLCETRNSVGRKIASFSVDISGVATVKTKVPVVKIDGSPKLDAEYDKPLQLKCKVSGYPKPSVIWKSDDKSAVLSHTMSPVELPYDYVSVLEINNVKKNTTFTCVAVNSAGNGDDSIQTKVNTFFKIVALPEDMTIEYQKERKIQCKAEALPPASVTWYKDSRPLRLDGNMDLSADGSVLTIRSMEPYMVGDYLCETRNSVGRKIASFSVDISGVATVKTKVPVVKIDGSPKINAEYDKPLQLKCKVSGYPKPSVIWKSDDKSAVLSHTMSPVELPYDYVSVLEINNVKKNTTFTCVAVNSAGNGDDSIQTKVNTFFKIVALPEDMTIEYQKERKIQCKAEALPPASVTWYKDSRPLRLDGNMDLSADGSVLTIRSMEPYMVGDYLCETRNSVGRKIASFSVDISGVESPEIRKDTDHIIVMKHSKAHIQCQVIKGHPKPTMHWLYKGVENDEFITLNETTDTFHFDNVEAANAGAYRCIAESDFDSDHHEIELIVEYKPSISRHLNSSLTANQGDTLTFLCAADGVPTPDITWRHNGAVIRSSRHTFFRDGSIRFTATLSDKGVYECEAKNTHGVDKIRIDVNITVPVDIESAKNSFIEQKVGLPVVLPCRADGTPKPTIMWVYRSKDDKVKPRIFSPIDASGELRFRMIQPMQGGSYTCVATDSGGSKNITYEVSVLAPPSIRYTTKQFRAVVDDMQLRIPCEATGNPKPDITWTNKGYNLASGSEWFDISDDGSLIINNIKKLSQGSYICTASNALGNKSEDFNVIVDEYPRPGFLSNSVMIEEGTTATIPCSVPQKRTDRLRWFKDGRIVSDSELELRNVKQTDSGTYTCRVSFVDRPARSGFTNVEVGFKPQFSYLDDEKNIPFQKEVTAYMDCTATGNPEPEVKWFHDGKEIGFTGFQYGFEMTNSNEKGHYSCQVSNPFGTVQQEFFISSSECILDIKNDFNDNEPLMLTTYDTFPNFESSNGYLHIPKDEMIKLSCPSGFNAIPSTDINVICDNEKQFILDPSGTRYDYSDLKCRDKLQPTIKGTGHRCTYGNSEMVNVGFEIGTRFKEIYQVCVDVTNQNPIYTKMTMQQPLANDVSKSDTEWFNDGPSVDFDSLYDCSYQNSEISAILDKEFHRYDGCCFARTTLVNPKDLAPGLPQAATYTHLNVAPQWGTCNSKNWNDVEQRVRNLVISSDRPLQVWTGTAQALQLPDALSEKKAVILNSRGKDVQVPMYLWKVVQDSSANASLAIIHVNVPDLHSRIEEAEYRLCTDVCKQTEWMRNRLWRDASRGYIYCCELTDFESAFRYHGIFPRHPQLLKDVSFISDSHYLHAI